MKSSRLLISLIPELQSELGHSYVYHKTVAEALFEHGFEHLSLVNKNHLFKSLPNGWIPFFNKKDNSHFSFLQTFIRFYDFARSIKKKRHQKSFFFLESFNTSDLIAYTLAVILFAQKKDAFWLLFRQGIHQLPMQGKIHKYLLKILRMRLKNRLLPLTDSKLIQKEYHSLQLVPIPHTEDESYKKPSFPIICWWPGEPRKSKGLSDIQKLAATQENLASSCLLRCSEKTVLPKQGLLNIEMISECLTRDEYRRHLMESDVILLPYDPVTYKSGTSGIFVEAVASGKMPLVKQGSWLSYELERAGLSKLIVDWDDPFFFERLKSLLLDAEIQTKLSEMRRAYQQMHCPAMFAKTICAYMSAHS